MNVIPNGTLVKVAAGDHAAKHMIFEVLYRVGESIYVLGTTSEADTDTLADFGRASNLRRLGSRMLFNCHRHLITTLRAHDMIGPVEYVEIDRAVTRTHPESSEHATG